MAVFSLLLSRSRKARQAHGAFALRKRPPLWLVLLIPLGMAVVAGFVALVSGTVVGFALAAVYSAGGFSMSTWVPFMWGMIQVVVLIIAWVWSGRTNVQELLVAHAYIVIVLLHAYLLLF